MTWCSQDLDALLGDWKRRVLPAGFPDLERVLSETRRPLDPSFWAVMEPVCSGALWRPHVEAWWPWPRAEAR